MVACSASPLVLIVDDEVTVLKALTEQLQSLGCIVQSATSVTECQDRLCESIRHTDLLIADYWVILHKGFYKGRRKF